MQAEIPFRTDLNDDAALLAIVMANPEWRLELSCEGNVLVSPLTGTATASKELEAALQLVAWSRVAGGKAYGPATGFRLPDKSVLGPDAAWISAERLAGLSAEATDTAFWHVCPDVAIEVMSDWDGWAQLTRKIDRYLANGAAYAVAVDSEQRRTYERGVPPPGLALRFEAIFDA